MLKYILYLTKSLHQHINEADVYTDPPGATITTMSNIQMKKWLLARRIKVVMPKLNGRASSVRKNDLQRAILVTGWKSVGDEPAPVVNPLLGRGYTSLANLIVSFHSLVCSVLNLDLIPSDLQLEVMDHWIKLYLSNDHQFTGSTVEDQGGHMFEARINVTDGVDALYDVRSGNVVRVCSAASVVADVGVEQQSLDPSQHPILAQRLNPPTANTTHAVRRYLPSLLKRNKINLIKLPFTLQRYGSYRTHLSELGSAGEGNVMAVRPLIKRVQGTKKNWEYNVARDWSTIQYCKRLTKSLADSCLLDDGHALTLFQQFQQLYESKEFDKQANDVRKMFHVYKNHEVVLGEVDNNQPLSFVYLNSGEYVACYSRSPNVEEFTGVCLNVTLNCRCQDAKMYLWQISMDGDSMSITFKRDNIMNYCVAAPTRVENDNVVPYYIITSNWEELVLIHTDTYRFQSPARITNLVNYS
jgi:hypothetical protein